MTDRVHQLVVIALACGTLSGCISQSATPSWGDGRWPGLAQVQHAAAQAARSPNTWVPLAGAALLTVTDTDHGVSEWAADNTPIFGSHAEAASDALRDAAGAAYVITALAAPSRSVADKMKGLLVGAGAVTLNHYVTKGLKSTTGRERPNGRNDASFPSGHTSAAATTATLASTNLDYLALPDWARTGLTVSLHGVAAATGWARVEAEQHHVTDVLVGYALGHFIARFAHTAFLDENGLSIDWSGSPGAGIITLRMALR